MIKYQLQCENDHDFAGWFKSSDAFDAQVKRKLVDCPTCGSTKVRKALMAPSVSTSRKKTEVSTATREEMVKAMRDVRRKVEETAEYVGPRFAEEARRIHYKETDEKGIYGEASLKEAKELADEGIDFLPLPVLPEDKN
ncbi:MAG: DUF1178 family protein [Hyphomicrobiaceae bacterium]